MELADVRDRASAALESVRANPIVQRIETFRYDPPPLDWKAILVVILTVAGAYYLGLRNGGSERDQWWRNEIAKSSQAVNDVLNKERPAIDAVDKEILKALRDTDAKLEDAEAKLEKAKSAVSPDGCPRIPAVCMRKR